MPYRLHRDPTINSLPADELSAILRAAESLIGLGGRSLLTKILRGSRSKDVLAHGHDDNPAYGFFADLTEEEVIAKIDWTILHRYLRIEYSGRLPVLVYAAEGWAMERDIVARGRQCAIRIRRADRSCNSSYRTLLVWNAG